MSNSNQDLEHAIISFFSSFQDLSHKVQEFQSLSDGTTLTEVMHTIQPNMFDLSKINNDIQDNWALRLNNLSYLYEQLETYYKTVLHKSWDRNHVDILKVSKNDNKESLYNLVELVIGAAVQCDNKEVYINKILELEESCQNALMDLIEKIIHKINPEPVKHEPEINSTHHFDQQVARNSVNTMNLAAKFEAQEKQLLAKLEELETDNHNLHLKHNDVLIEKDHMSTKVNELLLELNKKTEEVNRLLEDRENIQEKVNAQESLEELKNEIKLKDHKVEQLEEYIEELKHNHELEKLKFEEEVSKQKKKVEQLTKLEGTMDFYKQKYEDYSRITGRVSELEIEIEKYKSKIDELSKSNEALDVKVKHFKERLETEKTSNISLDIELTKKKTEIETLKSEKRRLEATNNDLETKINEINRNIEKQNREREDNQRHYGNNELAGQVFNGDASDSAEAHAADHREQSVIHESEKEILQQENEILKAKCKEIQIENENLKSGKSDNSKANDKLIAENNTLKQELEKLKRRSGSISVGSPTMASDEAINALKGELTEKTRMIGDLSEEIVGLKTTSQKNAKKLEDDVKRKDDELKELNEELNAMKSIITEVGDQKEEELKILAAAVQELALRNLNLEKQIQIPASGR